MDPHQLQNNMANMNGQPPQQNLMSQQAGPYQQMMLAQQQYLQINYLSNNQNLMLGMDPFQQQQYQQLMLQSQHPQQPAYQQQQQQQQLQAQAQAAAAAAHQAQQQLQQQILQQRIAQQHQQQQQQQQFSMQQQHQHQQQQAMHNHQQRLLEEQQKQIEINRQQQRVLQEQQRALLEEENRKMRIKEAEEQARQRELAIQREKERLEMLRQQEEEARRLEEQRRKEEAEQREREVLQKIADQRQKEQQQKELAITEMKQRLDQVANPLALVGTHFMTKYTNLLPFPSENMAMSKLPSVCDGSAIKNLLDNLNPHYIQMISQTLAQVDVADVRTRMDQENQTESNDLPLDQMPPLIKAVLDLNCNALDVDEEMHHMEANMDDLDAVLDDPTGVLSEAVNMNRPSTSTAGQTPEVRPAPEKEQPVVELDVRELQRRRQMASIGGKGPKAAPQRKKRDMVESLFDSLTDYFDPSEGRRRRMRTRTLEDDAADQRDLDLIAQMEANEHRLGAEGTSGASDEEQAMFYDKKARNKRKREEAHERPPTPTEIIHQRDQEWSDRQKKKLDKRRRRKGDDSDPECWNNDVMAENDSYQRFMSLVDQIFDQVEDIDMMVMTVPTNEFGEEEDEVSSELLIERAVLDDLRKEVQKLKSWKKLNKVPVDRLVKLVTMLERNMRDVMKSDGSQLLVLPDATEEDGEDADETAREYLDDRLIRAADAACTALIIMTSYKMPKQVYIEDAIDRAVNLCKHYLNYIVFPASDSMFRKNKKGEEPKRRKKTGNNNRSSTAEHIYGRVAEMVGCFSELIRVQSLPETQIHHLSSMAIASFFVSNVGELQLQAMRLASNIFSRYDETVQVSILNDMLNSLHRLPPGKNPNNSYRLGMDQWISNTNVLVMQLIQSVVKMPKRRRHGDSESEKSEMNPDTIVKDSFRDAQRLAGVFLSGFLSKCSCKGNKSEGEEDYRRLFDAFLQDLLLALYKPEWPAAEMMLTILGSLLVKSYRTKQTDMTIRQASLEYLGSITARLRKDVKSAVEDSDTRMTLVVKTLIYEEQEEQQYETVDDVDISEMSHTDRLKKLEQALIDYLVEKKGDGDIGVEFSVLFYAGEWYKETVEDLENAKLQFKAHKNQDLSDKERRKQEKKMERMNEKGQAMKDFLIKLVDKKQIRKRGEVIKRLGNVMMESDAAWAVKYLASRREFSHSFDQYLKQILYGVTVENTVSLRTRAMKCLTQIIEADHEVLGMSDVRTAVNSRMMDPNAVVREATIELLGKFLLAKEEFLGAYYPILLERIKDSGVAVRKRVIRIMREVCEKYPEYDKIPEMLAKMVRRVSDEDGVKKLVLETFSALWMQPVQGGSVLLKKVVTMTLMVQQCAVEQTVEYLEQMLQALLKQAEKSVLFASKQIVDTLVDNVLVLEGKMADNDANASAPTHSEDLSAAATHKSNQERLLACLTTLSLFSKVRPELMVRHAETLQPYLSMNVGNSSEVQVLNEVIGMLERVVPLMNHPSDSFLNSIDESLANLAMNSGVALVASAICCAAAITHKFNRKQSAMAQRFVFYLKNLNMIKRSYDRDPKFVPPPQKIPILNRSVYTIGLMCRYFDFDSILEGDAEAEKSIVEVQLPKMNDTAEMATEHENEDKPVSRKVRDNVFMLLEYFVRSNDPQIRLRALTSLGHFTSQYSEYLIRPEVRDRYITMLRINDNDQLRAKIQVLKNLELFLASEEKKMIKTNEEWEKVKDQQNLKEMEMAGSGLGSAVIQVYWNNIMQSYFNANDDVRLAAVQVVWHTLSQGLVTPGSSIPTLIAMTTDRLPAIRNKVENLLKEIDHKYQGMVQSKAIGGIRWSFRLQNMLHRRDGTLPRGIRACDVSVTANNARVAKDANGFPRYSNDGQAILSSLYQGLRSNRQQRRSFLTSILRLFSEDCREKLNLMEWIFVADNIAMFPYQVMDEPLYVIRHIDQIISLSGQAILNQFKVNLRPIVHGLPQEDDDMIFEPDSLFARFPDDKQALFELMENSQACFILLYLRNFLCKMFSFTEPKIQEYSPSEAAKVYEKAITRKNVAIFNPVTALEELRPEVIAQRNTFDGAVQLAHKICNFRKMLLSLDRMEEDDEEEPVAPAKTGNAEGGDDDEEEEVGVEGEGDGAAHNLPINMEE